MVRCHLPRVLWVVIGYGLAMVAESSFRLEPQESWPHGEPFNVLLTVIRLPLQPFVTVIVCKTVHKLGAFLKYCEAQSPCECSAF